MEPMGNALPTSRLGFAWGSSSMFSGFFSVALGLRAAHRAVPVDQSRSRHGLGLRV